MFARFLGLLLLFATSSLPGNALESSNRLRLEAHGLAIELMPSAGPRLVSLRLANGPNVLDVDRAHLDRFEAGELGHEQNWYIGPSLRGHIFWLSPQSQWWSLTTDYPTYHRQTWPPDPALTQQLWKVVEQGKDFVRLEGPHAKQSGGRFRCEYRLLPGGELLLEARFHNLTEGSLAWGIWSNSRMARPAQAFAETTEDGSHRFEFPKHLRGKKGIVAYQPKQDEQAGLIWLEPGPEPLQYVGKLQVWPGSKQARLHVLGPGWHLVKQTEVEGLVHPEHAPIEIYADHSAEAGQLILEAELHGPNQTLAAGEELIYRERITLSACEPVDTIREQIAIIRDWRESRAD